MNQLNYTVSNTPANKVTVTISRKQIWKNFISCWSDCAWDEYHGVSMVKDVADVLLCGEDLRAIISEIRQLFYEGNTVFFMGSAMNVLDVPDNKNILREIIIQDVNEVSGEVQDSIVIPHQYIIF